MRRGASRKSADRRIVPVWACADGMQTSAANTNRMRCHLALPMPPPSLQALRVDAIAAPKEAIMAPTLDLTKNEVDGTRKRVAPPSPFFVSAHSRRLRPFNFGNLPAVFVNNWGERARIPWPKAAFAEHSKERVRSGRSRFEIQ